MAAGLLTGAVSRRFGRVLLAAGGAAAACGAAAASVANSESSGGGGGGGGGGGDGDAGLTTIAALEAIAQRLGRVESKLEPQRSVLVVGGGIVGTSIALQLTRQGCRVCLLEADGETHRRSQCCMPCPASRWCEIAQPCAAGVPA